MAGTSCMVKPKQNLCKADCAATHGQHILHNKTLGLSGVGSKLQRPGSLLLENVRPVLNKTAGTTERTKTAKAQPRGPSPGNATVHVLLFNLLAGNGITHTLQTFLGDAATLDFKREFREKALPDGVARIEFKSSRSNPFAFRRAVGKTISAEPSAEMPAISIPERPPGREETSLGGQKGLRIDTKILLRFFVSHQHRASDYMSNHTGLS